MLKAAVCLGGNVKSLTPERKDFEFKRKKTPCFFRLITLEDSSKRKKYSNKTAFVGEKHDHKFSQP